VPFVIIQVIMVGILIAFPGLVTSGLAKKSNVDPSKIQIDIPSMEQGTEARPGEPEIPDFGGDKSKPAGPAAPGAQDPGAKQGGELEDLLKK
jgi:hypothetical protein